MTIKLSYRLGLTLTIFLLCLSMTPVLADEVIFDETVTVSAQSYRGWNFRTSSSNAEYTIEMNVRSGNDVNLAVMDDDNYDLWSSGGSGARAYLSKYKIGSITTTVTLGSVDKYWLILDNEYSILTSKSVYIKMTYVSGAVEDIASGIPGYTLIPVILGLLISPIILKKNNRSIK